MHHQPIPHLPSATESDTRAALTWALSEPRVLEGETLTLAREPLVWNPHALWLAPPTWDAGTFMVSLIWGAVPRLRFNLYRDQPHPVENLTIVHLPAHVFAAGD